jgi:4-hydroxyproline epimerase
MQTIQIIDSHTAGEPTRVVVAGGPELGDGPISHRLQVFREQFDHVRAAIINEPRGSDVLVGALLCEPHNPDCVAGVIFFNNIGFLGMCGHGTIGLVATLAYLGRISAGTHKIETPVGVVEATLHQDGRVTILNVPSYRYAKAVQLEVAGYGRISGDIAWGGNWFFLVEEHNQSISIENVGALTDLCVRIRQALKAQQITGANGAEIDHIELFGPGQNGGNSRNFVLCPGIAYDRSPCGTGSSAKIACLADSGKLAEGQAWVQEGIVGEAFELRYQRDGDTIRPSITGQAYITLDGKLILDSADPFRWGIPSAAAI